MDGEANTFLEEVFLWLSENLPLIQIQKNFVGETQD